MKSTREEIFGYLTEHPTATFKQLQKALPHRHSETLKRYLWKWHKNPDKNKIIKPLPTATPKRTKQKPFIATCRNCGVKHRNLSSEKLCDRCKYSYGRVWILNMQTWTWTRKPTTQYLTPPKIPEISGKHS